MPRWLKVLLPMVLLLGLTGLIGYHVLAWRAQDSLVVRSASIEREPDGKVFINFEIQNRSNFPVKVMDISTLYPADYYGFFVVPSEPKQPFLLKAGERQFHRASLLNPQLPMPSETGFLVATWTPTSAAWLTPLFSKVGSFRQRLRPGALNPMPGASRHMLREFEIYRNAQGTPKTVGVQEISVDEWRLAVHRWIRNR